MLRRYPLPLTSRMFLPVAFSLILLTSCAGQVTYRFEGAPYETSEAALAAQKEQLDAVLGSVSPVREPVKGAATVEIPSLSYIKTNMIVIKGNITSEEKKAMMIEYTARVIFNDLSARAEAVRKRGIFGTASVIMTDDPSARAARNGFTLSFLNNKGTYEWLLAEGSGSEGVTIAMPPQELPPAMRYAAWLENIEKAARDMKQ